MTIELRQKSLYINSKILEDVEVEKEFNHGANGYAYLVKNKHLERQEVLKIWTKVREKDKRDKTEQALKEVQKIVSACKPGLVPTVYSLNLIDEYPVMRMEYVKGKTLREFLETEPMSVDQLLHLAYLYLRSIVDISETVIHGDPHLGNVIVDIHKEDKYSEEKLRLNFIDFGTSHFSGQGFSEARHWNLVDRALQDILRKIPAFRDHAQYYQENYLSQLPRDPADCERKRIMRLGIYKDLINDIGSNFGADDLKFRYR